MKSLIAIILAILSSIFSVDYKLSTTQLPQDYELICNTVMNEAGAEPYEGMCAVAQCIYNAIERENKPFSSINKMYGYTRQKKASESVKQAVFDVFCKGYRVTEKKIICYYNPSLCKSAWHESNVYVMTIDHHRFFAFKGEEY